MNKYDLLPYFGKKKTIIKMFSHDQRLGRKRKDRHIHINNQSPILLVSHMDTVQTPRLDTWTTGAGFDDRLGVYTAHKLVKRYPEYFDLLLTDYEEVGKSTAEVFFPEHEYNLVIELDREGEDYVDYGLSSNELRQALKDYGFVKGWGSFSDICFMDLVDANKINVGLGTYNSHCKNSGFDPVKYHLQIERLMQFVRDHATTNWPEADGYRDYITYPTTSFKDYYGHETEFEKYDYWEPCDFCGEMFTIDELIYHADYMLCSNCEHILLN